jgi:hypothetical protein
MYNEKTYPIAHRPVAGMAAALKEARMVSVSEDREQKLVEVVITGFVKAEDVMRVSNAIKATMKYYGPAQAALLIDLIGFTPMSTDVLPMLRGLGRDVVSFFRRAALVQDFSMQFQGNRKAVEPPPGYKLPSFTSREAALSYLLAEEE